MTELDAMARRGDVIFTPELLERARIEGETPWRDLLRNDLDDLQRRDGEWAEATFGRSTPSSVVAHLRREVERELTPAVERGADVPEEAADCLLLLLHLAHKTGFSLMAAAEAKFARNRGRTWGEPDEEGVVEHVRIASGES